MSKNENLFKALGWLSFPEGSANFEETRDNLMKCANIAIEGADLKVYPVCEPEVVYVEQFSDYQSIKKSKYDHCQDKLIPVPCGKICGPDLIILGHFKDLRGIKEVCGPIKLVSEGAKCGDACNTLSLIATNTGCIVNDCTSGAHMVDATKDLDWTLHVIQITPLDKAIEGHNYKTMEHIIDMATTTEPAHLSTASVDYITFIAKSCASSADYDISCDKLRSFETNIQHKAEIGEIIIDPNSMAGLSEFTPEETGIDEL